MLKSVRPNGILLTQHDNMNVNYLKPLKHVYDEYVKNGDHSGALKMREIATRSPSALSSMTVPLWSIWLTMAYLSFRRSSRKTISRIGENYHVRFPIHLWGSFWAGAMTMVWKANIVWYYNGDKLGFNIFKTVLGRLYAKYDHLHWMKLSEIARYWAAKEYTRITQTSSTVELDAPFTTSNFTMGLPASISQPLIRQDGKKTPLKRVSSQNDLKSNTWYSDDQNTWLCFDLA